jgi:hypothetical protein
MARAPKAEDGTLGPESMSLSKELDAHLDERA